MDTQNLVASNNQHILAFVGMPGSGKSAATLYMVEKGIPRIRFGELTEETLKEKGLPVTPENERMIREVLRKEFGMAVYAQKAILKIQQGLQNQNIIAIDGLYSLE
jgi:dephospho-CoA kinase